MCGIAGIINKCGLDVLPDDLRVMTEAAKHRGPDGEGYFIEGPIGLGHRRLAIIDLSAAGHQPMHRGHLTITYNGEIYNYVEIKHELKNKGLEFITESDTEVVLAAYEHWGERCVEKFNGMWAFAILDRKDNKLFMSRDRFGIKPFHYFESGNALYFGSEIRQILPFIKERKVNKQVLFDFLFLGYHHHSEETFFEGVKSLVPGNNLIYDLTKNTYKCERYYELKVIPEYEELSFEAACNALEDTLGHAISIRLRSDVRVGTCLSGGMDSSYVAGVASPVYRAQSANKFTAITAKSIERKTDETHFAHMVVDAADLNWELCQPSNEDFLTSMDEVIEAQEEPFGSPSIFMSFFVMKKAKEIGCTVLLDGQGGDEALLGYDRYYASFINQQSGLINRIRSYILSSKNSKLSIRQLILYNLYFNNAGIRAKRQARRFGFVRPEYKRYMNKPLLSTVAQAAKNTRRLQRLEIQQIQLQKLLKYEDRNSMHFSIETRVPFVDYKLMELAYSLPFEYKMSRGWSKYILRCVAQGKLPREIVWRRNKFGFEAPTSTWMSDKQFFLDRIRSSSFMKAFIRLDKLPEGIDLLALWKLYNVAVWAEKFDVRFN